MTFEMSKLIGKTLKMTKSGAGIFTGTISEVIDENTIKLDRSSLTTTLKSLESTFNYEDSFTLEYDIAYRNNGDNAYVQFVHEWPFANIMHPEIVFISFAYEWDILVTHTSTGYTFHQELYYDPYTVSNNWAIFQFWFKNSLGTWVLSPVGFDAPRPSQFPFIGSNSGKMTLCTNTDWPISYQGETTFNIQCKLSVCYQSPHNYTGHITFYMTNIKYYNCRGEEIISGDKCLPILSGFTGEIE